MEPKTPVTDVTPKDPKDPAKGAGPKPGKKDDKKTITVTDIVNKVKEGPGLKGLTEIQATKVIRDAFAEVAKQLDTAEGGFLRLQGLGQFKVAVREQEKDGEKTTGRKISLRPAKTKEGHDKSEKKAGRPPKDRGDRPPKDKATNGGKKVKRFVLTSG